MKAMLRAHLDKFNVFSGKMSDDLLNLSACVTGDVAPQMVQSIAISELMLYASQFRRYINDPVKKSGKSIPIPINSISFVLAASGESKDKTVKDIRNALYPGYTIIEKYRKTLATAAATSAAMKDGKDEPGKWENHREYYRSPAPLFTALTNSAAYLDHLADLERLPVGAGHVYTGELGSEMETNADMIPAIRVMSEIYDVGYKEAKPLRNKDAQTPEIKNLAVSALFIGSHDNLLFDEKIKNLFKKEFTTKLARRSFFTFTPEATISPEYDSVEEMLRNEALLEEQAAKARERIEEKVIAVAKHNLSNNPQPLDIASDTQDIYKVYMRYNKEVANELSELYPITKLVRKHMQWKALKLAGAFAIFNNHDVIESSDLITAISYVESIEMHMITFEKELVKEQYQVFADYMRTRVVDGKSSINLHTLKQFGYITGTGNFIAKLKDLTIQASSYDEEGIYTVVDNTINFEEIVRTDVTGASFLEVSGTKDQRAKACATGYDYADTTFENLSNLLSADLAFTPFRLKDGKRGRDNIISGTKWICFDIDNSILTMEETSYILQDINHHIALTSDDSNLNKFRLIIELDAVVDVDAITWVYFAQSIASFLNVEIDKLPQSQIFFGYAGREVLSVTDQVPIEIKDHVSFATSEAQERTPTKEYSKSEKEKLVASPFSTFEGAFNATNGEGSRKLFGAACKAYKLGMEKGAIIDLVEEISEYWDSPFPPHRMASLHRQIHEF